MDHFSSSKMARESWPHGFGILYFILIHSACCCQVASVVSDSVRPHRRQPTRLPRPQDSPGKNTGVGCHFLLQCMKVKSESEVAQSCPTLSDPMDFSPPGSSAHGIFQAKVLEWGAIAFSEFILSLRKKKRQKKITSLYHCQQFCPNRTFKSSNNPPTFFSNQ